MSYILREKFRPPSETLYLTEPFRAIFELATLHLSEPWLNSLKGGDGHPVLVIPGFTAGDRSTALLRHFLSRLGYLPCGWKQGVNFGARRELFEGVGELLQGLHAEYDCRISIVGQSLGGIYARELAKHLPDAVRQVITLGSPFNDPDGDASKVTKLYKMFNPEHATKPEQFLKEHWEISAAPPVPTTSIYSRFDGVCHWRACIQHAGHDQVENIEVLGSHTGMGVNAQSLFVIADRLSQRRNQWQPFNIGRYFGFAAGAA
ncbi:alpha/beta hydrolase [Gammaproteobacteria bacterium]|jgi:esterase/lipase|nr:alpha/beta hydrolase [Gammaproteobacteria bacterium]